MTWLIKSHFRVKPNIPSWELEISQMCLSLEFTQRDDVWAKFSPNLPKSRWSTIYCTSIWHLHVFHYNQKDACHMLTSVFSPDSNVGICFLFIGTGCHFNARQWLQICLSHCWQDTMNRCRCKPRDRRVCISFHLLGEWNRTQGAMLNSRPQIYILLDEGGSCFHVKLLWIRAVKSQDCLLCCDNCMPVFFCTRSRFQLLHRSGPGLQTATQAQWRCPDQRGHTL